MEEERRKKNLFQLFKWDFVRQKVYLNIDIKQLFIEKRNWIINGRGESEKTL